MHDNDDREFDATVVKALKAFGERVREQAARRQAHVLARLQEEMIRLRPHKKRLLYGSDDPPGRN